MLFQSAARTLPSVRQTSGKPDVPGGTFGEPALSGLNPKYYPLVKAGKVFSVATYPGTSPGGNGGQVNVAGIVGVYNPFNSGIDVVILQTRFFTYTLSAGVGGSATMFAYYGGPATNGLANNLFSPQNAPCVNLYNFTHGGCTATPYNGGFSALNVVQFATPMLAPAFTVGNVPTGPVTTGINYIDEPNGSMVAEPGSIIFIANPDTTFTAGGFISMTMIWAEVPA